VYGYLNFKTSLISSEQMIT